MNKIYTKVWNKVLRQLVVASELASSRSAGMHGSGPARRTLAVAGLASAIGMTGSAFASGAADPGSATWTATAGPANTCVSQAVVAVGTTATWNCMGQTASGGLAL